MDPEIKIDPRDDHPSGLKPIASHPFFCSNKNVNHQTDALKELHGTPEKPIDIEDKRPRKYVNWEYEYILRKMSGPYQKCGQELLEDPKTGRSLDRIVVRDTGSNHHVFWFDVTEPMAEQGKTMEKAFADFKAGKPVAPEDRKAIEGAIKLQEEARRRKEKQ